MLADRASRPCPAHTFCSFVGVRVSPIPVHRMTLLFEQPSDYRAGTARIFANPTQVARSLLKSVVTSGDFPDSVSH